MGRFRVKRLGAAPSTLAAGHEAPTARVPCPECEVLAAIFLRPGVPLVGWKRPDVTAGALILAWGSHPRGGPVEPSRVPDAAATIALSCPKCGAGLRVDVAAVREALARSRLSRPQRCEATLADTPGAHQPS